MLFEKEIAPGSQHPHPVTQTPGVAATPHLQLRQRHLSLQAALAGHCHIIRAKTCFFTYLFLIKNKLLRSSPSISAEGAEGLGHNLLEKAQCLLTKVFWKSPCSAIHLHVQLWNQPSCAELPKPARATTTTTTQLKQRGAHAHMLKATKNTYKTHPMT